MAGNAGTVSGSTATGGCWDTCPGKALESWAGEACGKEVWMRYQERKMMKSKQKIWTLRLSGLMRRVRPPR